MGQIVTKSVIRKKIYKDQIIYLEQMNIIKYKFCLLSKLIQWADNPSHSKMKQKQNLKK